MSSFLISPEGLSMLADGIIDAIFNEKIADFPVDNEKLSEYFRGYSINQVFEELNYLNAYALEQRYGDDIDNNMYVDGYMHVPEYTIDEYLKMLDCFNYQCCEGDTEEKTLYQIMNRLADDISAYVNRNDNPLYDEANWG